MCEYLHSLVAAVWLIERLQAAISHEAAHAEWQEQYNLLTTKKRPHTEAEAAQIILLLRSMLKMDPKHRPTAEDVLSHPWFSGTSDEKIDA